MGQVLTPEEVRHWVRMIVERHGGCQKYVARKLGISEQYLCDLLKGNRSPSAKLAQSLGLRRVLAYEVVEEGE